MKAGTMMIPKPALRWIRGFWPEQGNQAPELRVAFCKPRQILVGANSQMPVDEFDEHRRWWRLSIGGEVASIRGLGAAFGP